VIKLNKKIIIFVLVLGILSSSLVSAGFWDFLTGKVTSEPSTIDILNEGKTKTYTLNGIDYEVALDYVNSTNAKFSINGELTPPILVDDSYKLADGAMISVNTITYQSFAGGVKQAEFSLSVGEEEVTCTDSDSGIDYNVKGSAQGLLGISSESYGPGELFDTFTDHCLSDFAMMENYCKENSEGDLWVYQSYHVCPNGCEDGACLPMPAEEETRCQTLGDEMRMYLDSSGNGYIGCDTMIYGDFSLAKSYCEGQKTGNKKYLIPDGYGRADRYYATLTGLDPKEEVKVFVVTNDGKKIECSPTLNEQTSSITKPNPPIDLSNYPNMFISNNKFNGVLVVGDKAPAEDVLSVTDIAIGLQSTQIEVEATKLAREITDPLKLNIISVGNPCTNTISAQLMGNPAYCTKGFTKDVGLIKLYNHNGYAQLLVAGYSKVDTRKAARVLANWNDYNLRGNEKCVYGSSINPSVKDCGQEEDSSKILPTFIATVEDKAPASDVIIISDVVVTLKRDGHDVPIGTSKLFSEVNGLRLDNRVTLAVYLGKAVIIVGEHSPANHVNLAADIKEILSKKDIIPQTILSNEVPSADLLDLFEDKDKEIEIPEEVEESLPPPPPLFGSVDLDECKTNADCSDDNACTSDLCSGTPKKCAYIVAGLGCNYNGNCVPIGVRAETNYCDIDRTLKSQLGAGEECNNNYECSTNICINNECVSQNFIQKIMNWFTRLFGG